MDHVSLFVIVMPRYFADVSYFLIFQCIVKKDRIMFVICSLLSGLKLIFHLVAHCVRESRSFCKVMQTDNV